MLRPRVFLPGAEAQEPRLMRWTLIFVRNGGGEGDHYFTATLVHVWCQMPHITLWFPYGGMDFRHDLDMVLPLGDVWDQRGMLVYFMFCDFDSISYVYIWMDPDSIICLCFCGCGVARSRGKVGCRADSSGASETTTGRAAGGRETYEG
jgi:hypothetical protein